MNRTWMQRAAAAGAGVALVAAGLAAAPSTSQAAVTTTQAKQAATCHQEGDTYVDTNIYSDVKFTNLGGYHIPPGVSVSRTRSVEISVQLTASVTTTAEASATVKTKVLADVGLKVGVTVAVQGTVAGKKAESVTWTIPKASKDRYYALYSARRTYTGDWDYYRCESDYWHHRGGGFFKSFGYTKLEGGALCTVGKTKRTSAYPKGSLPYRACQGTWW